MRASAGDATARPAAGPFGRYPGDAPEDDADASAATAAPARPTAAPATAAPRSAKPPTKPTKGLKEGGLADPFGTK